MIFIGEIKPLDDAGEEAAIGREKLKDYRNELQLSGIYDEVFRMLDPPPWTPLYFLNRMNPPGCPRQMIEVQRTEPGLYQYYCEPPFSELVRNPLCRCAVLYCGSISDKGLTDDFLNRLLDPAEEAVAHAMRWRLWQLGEEEVNIRVLLDRVRKRIQDHIRRFLRKIINTLCEKAVEITLAAVMAELTRQLSMKDVVDGFLQRFARPGEGIDIPVGKVAGETAVGLAIIGVVAELLELVFAL